MVPDRGQVAADGFAAGLVAVLFAFAVYSLGSRATTGMGDFFFLVPPMYAGVVFLESYVAIRLVRWVSGVVRGQTWRHDRGTAASLAVSLVLLLGAASVGVRWMVRQVRAAHAARVGDPNELLHLAEVASEHRDEVLAKGLVQNPQCPARVLAKFADSADWTELRQWHDSLGNLLRGDRRPVLKLVARHPNTPAETLAHLATEWPGFAPDVVANSSATSDLLRELSTLDSRPVQQALARDERTPVDVLTQLTRSEDSSVRIGVAANDNTTPEDLLLLAQDADLSVRRRLVRRENLPPEVVRVLARDSDGQIRIAASRRKVEGL
jgi:hypothetical protein